MSSSVFCVALIIFVYPFAGWGLMAGLGDIAGHWAGVWVAGHLQGYFVHLTSTCVNCC